MLKEFDIVSIEIIEFLQSGKTPECRISSLLLLKKNCQTKLKVKKKKKIQNVKDFSSVYPLVLLILIQLN